MTVKGDYHGLSFVMVATYLVTTLQNAQSIGQKAVTVKIQNQEQRIRMSTMELEFVITGKVNSLDCHVLLDTGAAISVVPESMVPIGQYLDEPVKVSGVLSTPYMAKKARVIFKLGDYDLVTVVAAVISDDKVFSLYICY